MGLFDGSLLRWLGKPALKPAARTQAGRQQPPPTSTQFVQSHAQPDSGSAAASQHAIRKDLLRVVLRETLVRNGIPTSWLAADLLRTTSPKREPGIHVRLLLRHWDPRLLMCGVAFEQNFYRRLLTMDPQATQWLMGVSWQYAMDDLSACPQLPHPGSWTAATDQPLPQAATHPGQAPATADVIAGPVHIARHQDDVRADLQKLLAARDADRAAAGAEAFASTQPISLERQT